MRTESTTLRSWTATLPAICLAAVLAFVWVGLLLAWGAALVQWLGTVRMTWTGWEAIGVMGALAWTAVCAVVLEVVGRRWRDRVFVAIAAGMALAMGLGWAWMTRNMNNWPVDSGLYRWFLERLATGEWRENWNIWGGKTDVRLWVGRALPLVPLRWLVGERFFALAVQIGQAGAGVLGVVLAWRTTRLLCGRKVARWMALAWVSMPALGMQSVGMNHQVWGGLYFVSGIWLLAEWMQSRSKAARGWLIVVATMTTTVSLLAGYIGKLYVLIGTLLLVYEALQGARERRVAIRGWMCLVAWPGLIGLLCLHEMDTGLSNSGQEVAGGGQVAFLARGWNIECLGEYAEEIDWLEALTPPERKNRLFIQYIAGQCAYHGPVLVAKLFPAKLAKFMLAGYASLGEEVLRANGAERIARVARGMRVGWFLLLYAPLMLWGVWRLSRRVGDGDMRTAWLLLPVALFGAAVMLAGETSPRYSMPVQALLIAAGAWGWECGPRVERTESEDKGLSHPFALGMGLVLVAYAVCAGSIVGLRGTWTEFALRDMRTAMLENGEISKQPFLAPFEAVFPDGGGTVTWPGKGGMATVYLRGRSWGERVRVAIATRPEEWQEVELPMRLESSWEKDEARQISIRRTEGSGPLHLGYVDVREPGE